jgi:RND superfamily putative drug exporter
MSALALWCLRHRRFIIVFWLAVFVVGGATAGVTTNRLTTDFSLPGQPGHETAQRVLRTYGSDSERQPILLVLSAPAGGRVSDGQAADAFATVQREVRGVRVVGKAQTGDTVFATDNGRAQFAYAFPPRASGGFDSSIITAARDSLGRATPPGLTGQVTGLEALANNNGGGDGPGVLSETLLAGVGALAVLAFVFASVLALVPLLVAAVAILSTFLVLLGLTVFADVSFIVQFLVSLVGLGVAIDYSLLLVTRWREERAHGRENSDAVVAAMETAGRAVLFSGLTVAVGLVALIVLPVPFLRSVGYGGMLIPLVSVAVTTTLLPALLGGIGPRVDWPRLRHEQSASRFWTGWARLVVRRRWIAAGLGVALLVALVIPFASLQIGYAKSESLAKSGPAYEALQTLERGGVPTGVLTPAEILTSTAAVGNVVDRARTVDGIVAVTPEGAATNRDGLSLVLAIPRQETSGGSNTDPIRHLKSAVGTVPGAVGVAGLGALQLDYLKAVYGTFPLVLGLLLAATYILLARAFRSLLLPLKAVLLNATSVAATFGAIVLFWQDGHGSEQIYGIQPTGAVTFWLPLMIFAFLYGLSMDYEVFVLARIREEYDAGGRTDAAVVEGVGRTGRLVTSAALILFLAFLSLSSGPETDLKVFATAIGFGILLDATVVRMLLVPALVSLFGRWNWYLPRWAAKLLLVPPSPARVEVPAPRIGHREEVGAGSAG